MPVWPALLKYCDEDELTYVSRQADWEGEAGLASEHYQTGDILIDRNGTIYRLQSQPKPQFATIEKSGKMSLAVFSALIKKHLVALDECCVSKLSFSSYEEGFRLLKDLSREN